MLADPLQGLLGCPLVDVIMDGDAGAGFGEFQRDPPADPSRASRDQRVLTLESHRCFPSEGHRRDHAADVLHRRGLFFSTRFDPLDHRAETAGSRLHNPNDES